MTFKELGIIEPIQKALEAQGYEQPTPIQEQSIPILLDRKDLLGIAQTGTGKTAAFAIPILHHMYLDRQKNHGPRKIRALIVTPTRELAIQIGDSFTDYGKYTGLKNTVIFGGVKQGAQTSALHGGIDILVATPGRLLDLMNQGFIKLKDVEYFVLDEADRMLDMGFVNDIKKLIANLPSKRQSLFFSATMPQDIVNLSHKILGNPEKVVVKPEQTTAERVGQSLYYVSKKDKPKLLTHLLKTEVYDSVLVFTRTKHGADKIVKILSKSGISAGAIHGNKSQNARQKALGDFKSGVLKVLIATDIAARGIDVSELSMVINYELPNVPETYVHRIGRTGRASASGVALSFCNGEEKPYLKDIQKLINQRIDVIEEHPFPDDGTEVFEKASAKPQRRPPKQGDKKLGKREPSGKSNVKKKTYTLKKRT
ncbi:MAG: DEAD/DEAH box helicase [Salinivirgaceae bacterium]|nr:DEAD/DEAH box helicase [Salinivirgaceae bacterium]